MISSISKLQKKKKKKIIPNLECVFLFEVCVRKGTHYLCGRFVCLVVWAFCFWLVFAKIKKEFQNWNPACVQIPGVPTISQKKSQETKEQSCHCKFFNQVTMTLKSHSKQIPIFAG